LAIHSPDSIFDIAEDNGFDKAEDNVNKTKKNNVFDNADDQVFDKTEDNITRRGKIMSLIMPMITPRTMPLARSGATSMSLPSSLSWNQGRA
jgi:hypothetical protein